MLDCNTPETLTLLTTAGLWWLPLVRKLWWWLESEWWPGWWPGWLTGGYCSVLPQLICPLTASCLNCGGFGWWSSEPWAESRERTEQRALESRTVTWRVTLSRYWRDVTRNWLQAVLPGPGASQLGPDCYVTTLARGNTGHRHTGAADSQINFMLELKLRENWKDTFWFWPEPIFFQLDFEAFLER